MDANPEALVLNKAALLKLTFSLAATIVGIILGMTSRTESAFAQSIPPTGNSTGPSVSRNGPYATPVICCPPINQGGVVGTIAPNPAPVGTLAPRTQSTLTPSTTTTTPTSPPAPPADNGTRDDPSARGGQRPQGASGQQVADLARTLIGRPYTWGGASPDFGFDCSGLVYYVYRQFGVTLDRDTFSQWDNGRVVQKTELQPGDIVFFADTYTDGISHDGIYVGNGWFVHAVGEDVGVKLSVLGDEYWSPRFAGARRIVN